MFLGILFDFAGEIFANEIDLFVIEAAVDKISDVVLNNTETHVLEEGFSHLSRTVERLPLTSS